VKMYHLFFKNKIYQRNEKKRFSFEMFFILHQHVENYSKIFQKLLKSEDKKLKLNICASFLKYLKQDFCNLKEHPINITKELLDIVKFDSKIVNKTREPTTLTTYASDCLLFLIYQQCEDEEFLFENLSLFVNYLREISKTNQIHRPIFSESVNILAKYFVDVNEISFRFHEKDLGKETKSEILSGLSSLWKNYIPYLLEQEKYHFVKKNETEDFFNSLFGEIQVCNEIFSNFRNLSRMMLKMTKKFCICC
jgi:hypothetical protein